MSKDKFRECTRSAILSNKWNYTDSKIDDGELIDDAFSTPIKFIAANDPTGSLYNNEIPLEKAVLLSSGRISIKNKLVREIDQDTTETILSFIYLLTGKIFSVSPNVSIVDFTLWKSGMTDGLCWVEFTRNEFARNISPALETITDIQNYNRVMDLKVRNGATVINSIAKQKFEKLVKQASNNV